MSSVERSKKSGLFRGGSGEGEALFSVKLNPEMSVSLWCSLSYSIPPVSNLVCKRAYEEGFIISALELAGVEVLAKREVPRGLEIIPWALRRRSAPCSRPCLVFSVRIHSTLQELWRSLPWFLFLLRFLYTQRSVFICFLVFLSTVKSGKRRLANPVS